MHKDFYIIIIQYILDKYTIFFNNIINAVITLLKKYNNKIKIDFILSDKLFDYLITRYIDENKNFSDSNKNIITVTPIYTNLNNSSIINTSYSSIDNIIIECFKEEKIDRVSNSSAFELEKYIKKIFKLIIKNLKYHPNKVQNINKKTIHTVLQKFKIFIIYIIRNKDKINYNNNIIIEEIVYNFIKLYNKDNKNVNSLTIDRLTEFIKI
jgi:hypothetical protein